MFKTFEQEEKYELNWVGKRKALLESEIKTTKKFIYCKEESVDWDTTENIFIEGDNIDALKLLQKEYVSKVKMIYIDPPYNTGKKRVYIDKFTHSEWLNMMYPRLKLARNLMTNDGVIFISIDDHEVMNLRKICDEIFGQENFLAEFIWKTDGNFDNQAKFKKCHEYILVYAKDIEKFPSPPVIDPNVQKDSKLYRNEIRNTIVKNGPKNPVSQMQLPAGFPADIEHGKILARNDVWPYYKCDAIIKNWSLANTTIVKSGWSSKELLELFIVNKFNPVLDSKGQETIFKISKTGTIEAIKKRLNKQSYVITVLSNFGGPQKAFADLKYIDIVFDAYPKPKKLISYLIKMNEGDSFITLDFFAGSCTTAHAILDLNEEDNGNRKFIMVQLPELTNKKSEAFKAGYKNIADIGKERIRRVGKKIKEKNPMFHGDVGFRVLKIVDNDK